MKDQNDNPVPDDLVVLENEAIKFLEPEELKAVEELAWYKIPNSPYILVSWEAVEKAVEMPIFVSELEDMGLVLTQVEYINTNLHRYNQTDGWYHA